jgi:Asp-tRNA(Asn)/Glu-tRNA(Gln) amidotransferase A subunit family amidase
MKTFFDRLIVLLLCFGVGLLLFRESQKRQSGPDVAGAERLIALHFSDAKRDSMQDGLNEQREAYKRLRIVSLPNSISPAVRFFPLAAGSALSSAARSFVRLTPAGTIRRPEHLEDAAFWSVRELGELIRTRQITSVELTTMYLERLKTYGPKLECVVTLTEERALQQARRVDSEIALGRYRGPLHGIPFGAKDLLSTKGIKTTWGSVPYKEQMIDEDATAIQKLEEAGAVLVAKLTLGELAWGDVWFGGMTRNPWNYAQGSSGSSAGSASATAAGLVAFAIGSETYGSIVSPSTRCGVTGLRPTFGRVSRNGAMALSWTMDKLGPICRTVEDCAIVFQAIIGRDGKDLTVVDAPFAYDPSTRLNTLRVGYIRSAFDSLKGEEKIAADSVLTVLRSLGASLIPVELPKAYPINDLSIILSAEAGAAFDELTRSGKDDQLVRQIKDAWPSVFRASRFIPAVEYIQANRIRSLVMRDMEELMKRVDVYVVPPFEGDNLLLTNLTGHPCVVLPNGFRANQTPMSITFIGRLFDEGTLLSVANLYQTATHYQRRHPLLKR